MTSQQTCLLARRRAAIAPGCGSLMDVSFDKWSSPIACRAKLTPVL